MEMRPPISTADLLRAFGELDPKSDEKRAIAAMLGFDWRASAATLQQAAQSGGEAQKKRADEEGDQRKTRLPERREPPRRRDDARRGHSPAQRTPQAQMSRAPAMQSSIDEHCNTGIN